MTGFSGKIMLWQEIEEKRMAMDAPEIERLIKAGIPDAEVTIRDLAGDGDHYAATVISASFRGKSRVQQHQLVYAALKGQMGAIRPSPARQPGVPHPCPAILAGRIGPGLGAGRSCAIYMLRER